VSPSIAATSRDNAISHGALARANLLIILPDRRALICCGRRNSRSMGPNHVERRRIIALHGKTPGLSVSARHKKGTARYNNNGSNCAKLDLRNASQVAKNDLTKLLFHLRRTNCRRVCGQRYDPHDVNSICSVLFSSTPAMGQQLPFLKGRIYG
jgi:hypothetical protein